MFDVPAAADRVLTIVQVVTYKVRRASGARDALVIAGAIAAPLSSGCDPTHSSSAYEVAPFQWTVSELRERRWLRRSNSFGER